MSRARAITAITVLSLLPLCGRAQTYPSDDVESLADRLSRRTSQLERSADRSRSGRSRAEDRALRDLFMLDSAAIWFARQARGHRGDLDRTADDFALVERHFRRAARSFAELDADQDLRAGFDAVATVLDQLGAHYRPAASRDAVRDPSARDAGAVDLRVGKGGRPAALPAGTDVRVALMHAVRSRDYRSGERVQVEVAEDVEVDGYALVPRGARAELRVVEMKEAGRVKGREHISFELVAVEVDGARFPLRTASVTYVAEESKERDAKTVGGSAAVGALIGLITDGGDGAAKGAAVGAAAGAGVVLATKGETVRLGAGHELEFVLEQPADILGRAP